MPTKESSIDEIVRLVNSKKKYPAIGIINGKPELAAIISKLVVNKDPRKTDINNPNSYYNLSESSFTSLSEKIQSNIEDSRNAQQLFPDLELAAQILVSSILSPKDMVTSEILYKMKSPVFCSELTSTLLKEFKNQCDTAYTVTKLLPQILREILFETGSYVFAVLPENAVDELINGSRTISVESLGSIVSPAGEAVSLGILGESFQTKKPSNAKIGLESFERNFYTAQRDPIAPCICEINNGEVTRLPSFMIEVSDNYHFLKLPELITTNAKNKVRSVISPRRISTESLSASKIEKLLYKSPPNQAVPLVSVPNSGQTKRKSIGRPLVLKFPSESVIPVCVPGNKREHVGYFVIIDEEGNPVSHLTNKKYLGDIQLQLGNPRGELSTFLLQRAKRNLAGKDNLSLTIPQATQIYASIIESDLIQRLKNGAYGRKTEIGQNNELYRIMLARALANQYTRMIYVPSELVTYFALKYHDSGIGKTLLDDLKILTSLRGILLFAKVMALTKNSIALTHVNMILDPSDPDPQRTIEIAMHELTKMRQQYFPLGINAPVDLVDWVQRAGLELTFEGHPALPQTKFEFETRNMQHTVPDSDLDELLRKQMLMAIGLTPETVDSGFQADFATTVLANNVLLSKRVTIIQDEFTPQLTNFTQIIARNDSIIRNKIIDLMKSNTGLLDRTATDEEKELFKENEDSYYLYMYDKFVDNVDLSLPKPDVTTIKSQIEAYDEYAETLEKTIDAWLNSDFMTTELIGELGSNIDAIKNTFKAFFLRRWQADNGFMLELSDIVTPDENGKATINLYEIMKEHNEGVVLSSIEFIKSLKPAEQAANTDLERLGTEPGSESPSENDGTEEDNFNMEEEPEVPEEEPEMPEEEPEASKEESETPEKDQEKNKEPNSSEKK
jgi:hypothetical protein